MEKIVMVNKIMNAVMNGKVLRFKLMNGIRYWLDKPSLEWEKFEANPSYQKRKSKKTNLQTNLFKDHD